MKNRVRVNIRFTYIQELIPTDLLKLTIRSLGSSVCLLIIRFLFRMFVLENY
jgi:hypothetical protein